MHDARKPPLGEKGQTEQLQDIFRLDQLEADGFRRQNLSRAKDDVPDRKDDSIIAVVLAAQRRVMGAVQRRRDDEIGQNPLSGNRDVGVVEQHEEHAHNLTHHHDMRRRADDDGADAFHDDLQQLIEDVETQSGRDVKALIAVMDFVKQP